MDTQRRNISLPGQLNRRLSTEDNASATVVKALKLYWEYKDSSRAVIKSNNHILEALLNNKTKPIHTTTHEQIQSPPKITKVNLSTRNLVTSSCCSLKKPCVHWLWDDDRTNWVNQLTGEVKE